MARYIYCVIVLLLIWRGSALENEENIGNVFGTNITRHDFSKLLQSLIDLNEERFHVMKKQYQLEDYNYLTEFLRTGNKKEKLKNLLLVVLSKNQTFPLRRNIEMQVADLLPSLIREAAKQNNNPLTRANYKTREEKFEILLEPDKDNDPTNPTHKNNFDILLGDIYDDKKMSENIERNDRLKVDDGRYEKITKTPPNLSNEMIGDTMNEYKLETFDKYKISTPDAEKLQLIFKNYAYTSTTKRRDRFEVENTRPKQKYVKSKNRTEVERDTTPKANFGNVNDKNLNPFPSIEMFGDDLSDTIFELSSGRMDDVPNRNIADDIFNEADVYTNIMKKDKDKTVILASTEAKKAGLNVFNTTFPKDNANKENINKKKSKAEPNAADKIIKDFSKMTRNIVKVHGKHKENLNSKASRDDNGVKVQDIKFLRELSAGQQNTKNLDQIEAYDALDADKNSQLQITENNGASQSNTYNQKKIEANDESENFEQVYELKAKALESRKNLQKCITKKGTKLCNKSCRHATKNVCRQVSCSSKAKKLLKKECKTSCSKYFESKHSKHSSGEEDDDDDDDDDY